MDIVRFVEIEFHTYHHMATNLTSICDNRLREKINKTLLYIKEEDETDRLVGGSVSIA